MVPSAVKAAILLILCARGNMLQNITIIIIIKCFFLQ